MSSLIPAVSPKRQHWYDTEKNTARLIQSIVTSHPANKLSADQMWSLITLTWITMSSKKGRKRVCPDHWKRLKVPALVALFGNNPSATTDLPTTIDSMGLPAPIAQAAKQQTGMVNFRGTWRKSSRKWCQLNRDALRRIIGAAASLPGNHEERFELARRIEALPGVKSPNNKADVSAGILLSPLIACLDSKNLFPILNGRESVRAVLRKLGLSNRKFSDKVQGVIGIIGQKDAFMLDVMSEEVAKRVSRLKIPKPQIRHQGFHQTSLRDYDEAERKAVLKSTTVTYKNLHNSMTAALNRIFQRLRPVVETTPAGRCDAVLLGYDRTGRDLLMEAKPESDKGSIRIAIGQLFDYVRHRERHAATDLVVVTITRPLPDYVDLLNDLGITAVWFGDKSCNRISGGRGKAWAAIAACIAQKTASGSASYQKT